MSRILLIEDDAPIRALLTRMLTAAGHEVVAAADGNAGLDLWRKQGADLVLTDIQMPGLGGIEVMRQLRADAPELPVIAVSGGGRSRDLDLLSAAGLRAVGLLQKPFTSAALRAAIAEVMKERQPERA